MSNQAKSNNPIAEAEGLALVVLGIHQWYPRKYDKQATREVAERHGGDASRAEEIGRYNKILVSLDSIKPLQTACRELREASYAMTAPWADNGQRVLPMSLYDDYMAMLREKMNEIEALADKFAFEEYDKQRELARVRLNGLFSESDYPPASEVRARFGVSYKFLPLPNPEDARVWGIAQAARDDIAAQVESDARQAIAEAQAAVVDRVVTAAREFCEKVERYSANELAEVQGNRLYTSSITNLTDVIGLVLDGLNVTGDQSITKLAAQLKDAVGSLEVADLKASAGKREEKVKEVKNVLSKFDGVF